MALATAQPRWQRLADRLVCPECHSPLSPGNGELVCQEHEHTFPLLDGLPVLLTEQERAMLLGDLDAAELQRREYKPGLGKRVLKGVKWTIGSTLHLPVSKTVRALWEEFADEPSLEVGSGTDDGGSNQVNLDISAFSNVDVIGSALNIPYADNTFQLVRNVAVLEHVRDPNRMIAEMHRVCRPGGYVYTEVPFLQHFHAYPNDFQRYTTEGLKEAFREFECVETGVCVGPSSAITALTADWFELLTFSNKRWINDIARTIPLVLMLPLKFLDYAIVKWNPRAHEVASGTYLLARKKS